MVEMHDWSVFLKEKKVTLAGMDKPVPRRGMFNAVTHDTTDPVNRAGHIKIQDRPLHGYTDNYVGPRGRKNFEETSYGKRHLGGWGGGSVGFGTGAALGSHLGPLGTLAGGVAGRKVGANLQDIVGRGKDNWHMSRMWRMQQDALRRQHDRGNVDFPGTFAGKAAGNARIADYIWKPGDPFKIYTDKGSHEIQRFMGAKAPVFGFQGSIVRFLNKILGGIPGLRDPQERREQHVRAENLRLGTEALRQYHAHKNKNPRWEMSDGDRRLVANMMSDYYSTQHPELDPKEIRMMANGASRWNEKDLNNVHLGLMHYLKDTKGETESSPMRTSDVRDDEVRDALAGRDLPPDAMASVSAAVREHQEKRRDRKKSTEREEETFEEGGPEDEYSDVPLMEEGELGAVLGDWRPLHQQLDDPTKYLPEWRADSDNLLRLALNDQKRHWHDKYKGANISDRQELGGTPEERLHNFFLHKDSIAMSRLQHIQNSDSYNDKEKMSAKYAIHALEQLVNGHHGTAWDEGHGPEVHSYSKQHGTDNLNRIMSFMLFDSEGNDIGHAHSDETHGAYDPMHPISYFGTPQQPAQEEAAGFDVGEGGLGDVYEGHEE